MLKIILNTVGYQIDTAFCANWCSYLTFVVTIDNVSVKNTDSQESVDAVFLEI